MRILHVTILAAASLTLAGVGTSAWAAQTATPNRPSSHTAVVATGSPVRKPVTKPLTLDVKTATVGQPVGLAGSGCNPGTEVFLSIGPSVHPRDLSTVTADHAGAFTATVKIPAGTPTGTTSVWAACKAPNETGKELSTATLAITG